MKTPTAPITPTLDIEITKERYQNAVQASSASCVVADAIKEKYPRFSRVKVNIATIQVTDRKEGVRYIYLTPTSVGEQVLAFDQGWPEEAFPKKFFIRRAVKIVPITRSASDVKAKAERRTVRLAELESKEQSGEVLSREEKSSLSKLRKRKEPNPRSINYGKAEVIVTGEEALVHGGAPPQQAKFEKYHANLLHERDRHFGAKLAKPSEVFQQAVDIAVKEAIKADRKKRKGKKS